MRRTAGSIALHQILIYVMTSLQPASGTVAAAAAAVSLFYACNEALLSSLVANLKYNLHALLKTLIAAAALPQLLLTRDDFRPSACFKQALQQKDCTAQWEHYTLPQTRLACHLPDLGMCSGSSLGTYTVRH